MSIKLFLKRVILFLLTISLLTLFVYLTLQTIVRNQTVLKTPEATEYAVFGHSHPNVGISDTILTNVQNYAKGGESYYYTYPKIQFVLKQNPKIKTVFIEFTNNQVESFMDNKIWYDKYVASQFKNLSLYMSFEDYTLLLAKNPSALLRGSLLSLKLSLRKISGNDYSMNEELGGYKPIHGSLIDSLTKVLNTTERFGLQDKTDKAFETYTLTYLRKCISFCRKNNVNVFLIRLPQHSSYLGRGNEPYFQNVRTELFSDVGFLDFNDFTLDDNDFFDLHHLNINGANEFSTWFKEFLKDKSSALKGTRFNYIFKDEELINLE